MSANKNTRKEKRCHRCGKTKLLNEFVNIYGFENPRGKYCSDCHKARMHEEVKQYMDGRDFCLYCGTIFTKHREYASNGKPIKTFLHQDHMDALASGGEDSPNNTVFCCASCNVKKGDKSFADWLGQLKPKYRKLSRNIYVEKHGREPEDFEPTMSGYTFAVELDFSAETEEVHRRLREKYKTIFDESDDATKNELRKEFPSIFK